MQSITLYGRWCVGSVSIYTSAASKRPITSVCVRELRRHYPFSQIEIETADSFEFCLHTTPHVDRVSLQVLYVAKRSVSFQTDRYHMVHVEPAPEKLVKLARANRHLYADLYTVHR